MLLPQASADLPADLHKPVAAGYRESYLTINQVLVSISVPKSNQPRTVLGTTCGCLVICEAGAATRLCEDGH